VCDFGMLSNLLPNALEFIIAPLFCITAQSKRGLAISSQTSKPRYIMHSVRIRDLFARSEFTTRSNDACRHAHDPCEAL
jgi:hypothetical protein